MARLMKTKKRIKKMDKPSEQRKSHKEKDDKDIGYKEYGIDNCREQLNGLWGVASEKTVGLSPTRIITNNYTKKDAKKTTNVNNDDAPSIIDSILENGPPLMNMSKPRRVF